MIIPHYDLNPVLKDVTQAHIKGIFLIDNENKNWLLLIALFIFNYNV